MYLPNSAHNILYSIAVLIAAFFLQSCSMERSVSTSTASIIIEYPQMHSKPSFARILDSNSAKIPAEVTQVLFSLNTAQGEPVAEYDLLSTPSVEFHVSPDQSYVLKGTAKANDEILFYGEEIISGLRSGEARRVAISLQSQLQLILNIQSDNNQADNNPLDKPLEIKVPVGITNKTQFEFNLDGLQNKKVSWYVNDVPGGNAMLGTINEEGEYTPPELLPDNINIQLKVVPEIAPSFNAIIDLTLFEDPESKPIIEIDNQAPIVNISPIAGLYNNTQQIEISCDDCVSIYYTTDDTKPDTSSNQFVESINIDETLTVKFFAKDSAGNSSEIQAHTFIIDGEAPNSLAQPPAGIYNTSQSIVLSCQDCSAIYYSLGDNVPDQSSTLYTTPITINSNQTIRYFAVDLAGNQEGIKTEIYQFVYLSAPDNFQTSAGEGKVELSWSSVIGADSYTIYRSTTPDVSSNGQNIQNLATTSYVDHQVINNTKYYYAVVANKQNIASPFTIEHEAWPDVMITSLTFTDTNLAVCINNIVVLYVHELTELDCADQDITNLEGIEALTDLQKLYLQKNDIIDISALSEMVELTHLDLYYNEVEDIKPLMKMSKLNTLNLSRTYITDIGALSGITSLRILNLEGLELTSIDALSELVSLNTLDLSLNDITSINALSKLTELNTLDLSSNEITNIDALLTLTGLRTLNLDGFGPRSYNLEDTVAIDLNPLSEMTWLNTLSMRSNELIDLSVFSTMKELASLDLSSNKISDITALSEMDGLSTLDLSFNEITNIAALAGMTGLRTLYLDGIGLRPINFEVSVAIDLDPLSEMIWLNALFLQSNHITDISALSTLKDLKTLDLSRNEISDIEVLSEMTKLSSLYLYYNNIVNVDALSNLSELSSLYLSYNNIVNIDALSNLSGLSTLGLSNNKIVNIDALSNLSGLNTLRLSNNNIHDINALSSMTKLVDLYLFSNDISQGVVSLKGISPFPDNINLEGNLNIPCADIESLDYLYDNNDGANAGAVLWTSCI